MTKANSYVLAAYCQGSYQPVGKVYTSIEDAQRALDDLYKQAKIIAAYGDY